MTVTTQPECEASSDPDSRPIQLNEAQPDDIAHRKREQVAQRAGALLKQGYH